jgi:hypothetical protein
VTATRVGRRGQCFSLDWKHGAAAGSVGRRPITSDTAAPESSESQSFRRIN